MSELSDFLNDRGYQRLALTRSVVGHFHTQGTLNGRSVEILVDTGAACTCVALSLVRALGISCERLDDAATGAGGAFEQFRVDGADLRLGSFTPRISSLAGFDFEHVNAPLRANGSAEVDMILGVDVFDAHAAILDYETHSLFLRTNLAEQRDPPKSPVGRNLRS
jgi:clan AA aspartic protease (TIGR02281 family)